MFFFMIEVQKKKEKKGYLTFIFDMNQTFTTALEFAKSGDTLERIKGLAMLIDFSRDKQNQLLLMKASFFSFSTQLNF